MAALVLYNIHDIMTDAPFFFNPSYCNIRNAIYNDFSMLYNMQVQS